MMLDRTDRQLQVLLRRSEHSGLIDLWLATHYDSNEVDVEDQVDFSERRDTFLWALERFLQEGRIKLHNNGRFFDEPIGEQVETFRQTLPISEQDADKMCTKPGYEPAYEGFGMNVWWFLDICPAGVAWRQADGSYLIAD